MCSLVRLENVRETRLVQAKDDLLGKKTSRRVDTCTQEQLAI